MTILWLRFNHQPKADIYYGHALNIFFLSYFRSDGNSTLFPLGGNLFLTSHKWEWMEAWQAAPQYDAIMRPPTRSVTVHVMIDCIANLVSICSVKSVTWQFHNILSWLASTLDAPLGNGNMYAGVAQVWGCVEVIYVPHDKWYFRYICNEKYVEIYLAAAIRRFGVCTLSAIIFKHILN